MCSFTLVTQKKNARNRGVIAKPLPANGGKEKKTMRIINESNDIVQLCCLRSEPTNFWTQKVIGWAYDNHAELEGEYRLTAVLFDDHGPIIDEFHKQFWQVYCPPSEAVAKAKEFAQLVALDYNGVCVDDLWYEDTLS